MIALGQFWLSEKDMAVSVAEEWETGHYIVVLGVDKDYVYIQDPFARMSKAFIPRKTFEEHWHQVMGGKLEKNPKLVHLGIFVRGKKPAERRPTRRESRLYEFGFSEIRFLEPDGSAVSSNPPPV